MARIQRGDFTLRGLVVELAERGLKVDYRSVWDFVHTEKLSLKKNAEAELKKTVLAGEQDRLDSRAKAGVVGQISKPDDARCLVFLDETWAKTNMAPLRR